MLHVAASAAAAAPVAAVRLSNYTTIMPDRTQLCYSSSGSSISGSEGCETTRRIWQTENTSAIRSTEGSRLTPSEWLIRPGVA